jgi:predicted acylesterase/phospholipase RssA
MCIRDRNRIVKDSLGYSVIGDLPFPSAVSATSVKLLPLQKQTMRFSNLLINAESNPEYDLIDLLMASAAIPVVFPPVRIRNASDFPQETFMDGGISDDHIPYAAVLQFQKLQGVQVEKLIIVSRKSDSIQNLQNELVNIGLTDSKLFEKLGVSLQRYTRESFIRKIIELQQENPDLAMRTYIYIPDFDEDFPMLNFNLMKEQYMVSSAWAKHNQPILLSEYLKQNPLPEK